MSDAEIAACGFKRVGKNVKISKQASIYNQEEIEIGDYSRIDDFCLLSGRIVIGSYCHITPMCLLAGGKRGIFFSDFCTVAYGVKIFSQSDDYSGLAMTNSTIPKKYKNEFFSPVFISKHVIIGSNSCILPGCNIAEGCSIGAMSLINKPTTPWGIYYGIPARRMKERDRQILKIEKDFLEK